jgi:hypothetical protein
VKGADQQVNVNWLSGSLVGRVASDITRTLSPKKEEGGGNNGRRKAMSSCPSSIFGAALGCARLTRTRGYGINN